MEYSIDKKKNSQLNEIVISEVDPIGVFQASY
jgi:hypothetical protein